MISLSRSTQGVLLVLVSWYGGMGKFRWCIPPFAAAGKKHIRQAFVPSGVCSDSFILSSDL